MTVIQKMMNELNNTHPHLFNIHTTAGRKFIDTCHKYLEIEKKQQAMIQTIDYEKILSEKSNQYKFVFEK
jgi:hypothetical protein